MGSKAPTRPTPRQIAESGTILPPPPPHKRHEFTINVDTAEFMRALRRARKQLEAFQERGNG